MMRTRKVSFGLRTVEGPCHVPVDELYDGHVCFIALPRSLKLQNSRVASWPLAVDESHKGAR